MHFLSLLDLSQSKSGFDANNASVDPPSSAAFIGGRKIFDVVLPVVFWDGVDVIRSLFRPSDAWEMLVSAMRQGGELQFCDMLREEACDVLAPCVA